MKQARLYGRLERVLIGLPVPEGLPVACHWSLSSRLGRLGFETVEVHNFETLAVELVRQESYLAVVHSGLLALTQTSNARRAFLTNLANRFKHCGFRVWDPLNQWIPAGPSPTNFIIWTARETQRIEALIKAELDVWN